MRLIDEQYLKTPWYGLSRHLRRQGFRVNRGLRWRLRRTPLGVLLRDLTPNQVWLLLNGATRDDCTWQAIEHHGSPRIFVLRRCRRRLRNTIAPRSSTPIKGRSSPVLIGSTSSKRTTSKSRWTAKVAGWTMFLSSGCGAH